MASATFTNPAMLAPMTRLPACPNSFAASKHCLWMAAMILFSLALGWLISPYWLLLAAFVRANMLQAAFTGFCPAAMIFERLGLKPGPAF